MAEPNVAYFKDLMALHQELAGMSFVKESTGQIQSRTYKYLNLPDLMAKLNPVLHKHGFLWTSQPSISADGQPSLKYWLIHKDHSDGGEMLLMSKGATPQDQGSAITYARRYAITTQLGIVADEDDDAAKAQEAAKNADKTLSKSKETDIYSLLERIQAADESVTLEGYNARLQKTYGVDEVEKLTNQQADQEIQRMTAWVMKNRVSANAKS